MSLQQFLELADCHVGLTQWSRQTVPESGSSNLEGPVTEACVSAQDHTGGDIRWAKSAMIETSDNLLAVGVGSWVQADVVELTRHRHKFSNCGSVESRAQLENHSLGTASTTWHTHTHILVQLSLPVSRYKTICHTILVGWGQEVHLACKKLGVSRLVVMNWLELCTSCSFSCHHHLHHRYLQ